MWCLPQSKLYIIIFNLLILLFLCFHTRTPAPAATHPARANTNTPTAHTPTHAHTRTRSPLGRPSRAQQGKSLWPAADRRPKTPLAQQLGALGPPTEADGGEGDRNGIPEKNQGVG